MAGLRRCGIGGLRRAGGGLRRAGGISARGRQGYFATITGFQISQRGGSILEGEVGAGRYPPIGVGPGGVLPEVEFRGEGGPRGGGCGGCGGGSGGLCGGGGNAGDELPGGVRSGRVGDSGF